MSAMSESTIGRGDHPLLGVKRGHQHRCMEERVHRSMPALRCMYDQFDRAARVLVLTSQAFDLRAEALPPNVRYVGAPADDVGAPPWRSPWSEAESRPGCANEPQYTTTGPTSGPGANPSRARRHAHQSTGDAQSVPGSERLCCSSQRLDRAVCFSCTGSVSASKCLFECIFSRTIWGETDFGP